MGGLREGFVPCPLSALSPESPALAESITLLSLLGWSVGASEPASSKDWPPVSQPSTGPTS